MANKKLGKNRGIWCGVVVSDVLFSHEIKDKETNEVIETFYKFDVETVIKNKQEEIIDCSVLPMVVPESTLDVLEKVPKKGDIVFLKGSWRAYDYKEEGSERTRLEQNALIKLVEVHDTYPVRTRNKVEFEGVLVKKLYKFLRDEDGKPIKDENGRLIPKLDEFDNMQYTVRRNKEGKIINDYTIAVNRTNGSDYIPCISYTKLATKIAKEVEIGSKIKVVGYVRTRSFQDHFGNEKFAYETVVTSLEVVSEAEELENENGVVEK